MLEASGAKRVVEIGALRGETTIRLLHDLGRDAELHVIDPVPRFDPNEHERRFPGRYHFHRDLSHNVLPSLPVVDAALVDGDHNWYTVYNELKMLAATAREDGALLPVLMLHDVGWPYGRRDLYYDPDQIPEQYRQPYAQRGIRRSQQELLEKGGFNARMNNALLEGGPRNGVMTALEDFASEHDRDLRIVVLPIFFGLAIVVENERQRATPELAELLDRMQGLKFVRELLTVAEVLRLKEAHWAQAVYYNAEERHERAAARYLALLKAGADDDGSRLELIERCLGTIRDEKVGGDLVDWGTRDGGGPVLMRGFLEAHEMSQPEVWVAAAEGADSVRERLARAALLDERVRLLDGDAAEALGSAAIDKVALLAVDDDAAMGEVLERLYGRVTLGGFVVVEGYAEPERRRLVDAFRGARGSDEPLETADPTRACWRRLH